jgi:diadenosine tetraphosphate (Ap4A) HIT family hydrolase
MNATITRFGYPETLVADYGHWVVLLRPQAPALFSLVLAAKGEATDYGALDPAAFTEQGRVVADIEAVLGRAVSYEKINYLMLMMVDRNVHFHVVPRYSGERMFQDRAYPDAGWPKLPDLSTAITLTAADIAAQVAALRADWPARG